MASLWMLIQSLITIIIASEAYPIALPGCPDRCGDVTLPYPFGSKEGCYLNDEFYISCNNTYNPPKAFLTGGVMNVTQVMLGAAQLRVLIKSSNQCYNQNGTLVANKSNPGTFVSMSKFTVSYSRNKLTVIGCDAYAYFFGNEGNNYKTGCFSTCMSLKDVVNGSCTGIGCCQTSIPKRVMGVYIALLSFNNHTYVYNFDSCSHAFVVEESAYNFSSLDFHGITKMSKLPVILDWTIGNQTCEEAKKNRTSYLCKVHSYCYDSDNGPGYRCNCSQGYEGNPYLPNGCQDINECRELQPCNRTCQNLPGSYRCSCPQGYEGDGKKGGTGCAPITSSDRNLLIAALVTSVSICVLILVSAWLYCGLQQRKLVKLRKRHFQQNGGVILQKLLSQHEQRIQTFKHYTTTDLMKATNNYHDSMILGQGGQGTVYKGVLPDERIVAIKKPTNIDKTQIKDFINEIVILSQINHRNVVKLVGCCLETQVPMLVYEFVANGTLFDHIHKPKNDITPMPWNARLRIAGEAAEALSYLHSSASAPIIHRDVKTSNILIDEAYTAKVSDFGISRFAPVDRSSLTTLVQGTLGYLDPEYFFSSQLTEKSDVYSFGVVLVELLTGEKAVCFDRCEKDRSLAMYFVTSVKEGRLTGIIEGGLKEEANMWHVNQVAMIAASCLRVGGEDRPSMKEVAAQLEALGKMNMVENNWGAEETEMLLA